MKLIRTLSIAFFSSITLFIFIMLYKLPIFFDENSSMWVLLLVLVLNLGGAGATIGMIQKLELGKWIYLLYLPFLNLLGILLLILPLMKGMNLQLFTEPDDYGLGIIILLFTVFHWMGFVLSVAVGQFIKNKAA